MKEGGSTQSQYFRYIYNIYIITFCFSHYKTTFIYLTIFKDTLFLPTNFNFKTLLYLSNIFYYLPLKNLNLPRFCKSKLFLIKNLTKCQSFKNFHPYQKVCQNINYIYDKMSEKKFGFLKIILYICKNVCKRL